MTDFKQLYPWSRYNKKELHKFEFICGYIGKGNTYFKGDPYPVYEYNYYELIDLLREGSIQAVKKKNGEEFMREHLRIPADQTAQEYLDITGLDIEDVGEYLDYYKFYLEEDDV